MCSVSTILLSLRVVQHECWNLAISLHRGISIVTVVLPLIVTLNFNRSSSSLTFQCTLQIIIISYFSMHITGEYLSNCLTFVPLEMWHELFCHNFENYSQLSWMRKLLLLTSSTWLRHAESSNLLLRMGVPFIHFTLRLNRVLYSIWQYFSLISLHELNIVFIISTFASHDHVSFLSWGSYVTFHSS